jgi:hypothetical protein
VNAPFASSMRTWSSPLPASTSMRETSERRTLNSAEPSSPKSTCR